ncbi:MAG TPA: hypothetical protein VII40_19220 [Xanthobacteraceae bacterium]
MNFLQVAPARRAMLQNGRAGATPLLPRCRERVTAFVTMLARIHTISDYYDGPRSGIADFDGKPHCYECEFDHAADDYSDIFRLTPIDDRTFQLVMEQWDIWLRWEAAFKAGRTSLDTHPAIPVERMRYEELDRIINGQIDLARSAAFRVRGRFLAGGVEWSRFD